MNTHIMGQGHADLSNEAREGIKAKFATLGELLQNPAARTEVHVTKGGHGGYTLSATVHAVKDTFFAEATRSHISEAVDEVVHTLREHIARHKDKAHTISKRAGDMFKKMARLGRG